MKKLLPILILLTMIGCQPAAAGLVSQILNNAPLQKPDANYELDTYGANSEVYEFTPRTAPEKTCIVFMLDNLKSMSMQCFDKKGVKS